MSVNIITHQTYITSGYGDVAKYYAERIYAYFQEAFPYSAVLTSTSSSYDFVCYTESGYAMQLTNDGGRYFYVRLGTYNGTFTAIKSYSNSKICDGGTINVKITRVNDGYIKVYFDNVSYSQSVVLLKLVSRLDSSVHYAVAIYDYLGSGSGYVYVEGTDGLPSDLYNVYTTNDGFGLLDNDVVILDPVKFYSNNVNLGYPLVGQSKAYCPVGFGITKGKKYTIGGKEYYAIHDYILLTC